MCRPKVEAKWSIFLVCVLLCLGLPLPAMHKLTSLSTMMYNDSVTFGLGENQDDLRSYGVGISFDYSSGWVVESLISGITLRSTPDRFGSRFDEMVFKGGYRFHFHLNHETPSMSWDILPMGGLVFAGNFGLDFFQNSLHKILKIDQVHEPYEDGGAREIFPILGMKQVFEYTDPAPWFTVSDLVFRAEVEAFYAPTYMGRIFPQISVGQHTLSTSQFEVGLGYAWEEVYDEWSSHALVGINETGLIAYVKGSFGIISFDYQWYLDRMQGYGGFGLQFAFDQDLAWTRSDLLVSLGAVLPYRLSSIVLRYVVVDDFGIYIKNAYKMIQLDTDGRVRENFSTWYIGGDYEISQWDFGWAKPFVKAGIGIADFLVMKDAAPASLDTNRRVREFSAICFSAEAAVGLRIFNQGELQYNGSAYGFELSSGIIYGATDGVSGSSYDLQLTEKWRPYVRLGLTVGSQL